MFDLVNMTSYVILPQFRPSASAGQHFNPDQMCEHCRREAAGEDVPVYSGNVVSFFSKCAKWNGCVVCGFCRFAMLDLMAQGSTCGVVPDCPECGSVTYMCGAQFQTIGGNAKDVEKTFVNWHRRMRCLEQFAIAAGLAAFVMHDAGAPPDEEDFRKLFQLVLAVTDLSESDEGVNHFFDRLQETVRLAELVCAPPMREEARGEPQAGEDLS